MSITAPQEKSKQSSSRDLILFHLDREPGLTVQQVATLSGIGRSAAQQLLSRMEKGGLVKKADKIIPHTYHLPYQKKFGKQNQEHEKIGGDIYVYCQDIIQYWDYKEQVDFLEYRLKPDRASIMAGKIIMWELDRATMTKGKIIQKIEKYLKFAQDNKRQFTVIFATTPRRAKSIAGEFEAYRNGYVWFAAVDVTEFLANPHAEILLTINSRRVSIHQLI